MQDLLEALQLVLQRFCCYICEKLVAQDLLEALQLVMQRALQYLWEVTSARLTLGIVVGGRPCLAKLARVVLVHVSDG